jgi:hypothetical protein
MLNITTEAQSIQSPLPVNGRSPLHEAWDFVDKIYCISLDHRTDRRQQAAAQFAKVGLGDRVEFMIGVKHPTNAERGNFIAQMDCLRAGVAAGANTICIFEDDIVFERFSPQRLGSAVAFMQSNTRWKMFFLGCFVKSARRTRFPSVINIRFRSTTHAYIITREFAQKLLEIPWPGRCLDDLICSMNDPAMYAIHPMIAFQSNSPTDNDRQIYLDRYRRVLGGLRPLQKLNEFAAVNRGRLILIHVVAIFAMAAGAVFSHFHFLHQPGHW